MMLLVVSVVFFQDETGSPGLVVAVSVDGNTVYREGLCMLNSIISYTTTYHQGSR